MPNAPSDLFAGEDLVVLARYETPGEGDVRAARIWFEGRTPDGPVRWETTARFPERERDNAFVPRLWATRRIGWLSAERRRSGPNGEIDGEIRRLGETYGIPTELTSYLVLEPGMDPRIANGAGVRQDAADASAVAPQASSGLQGRATGASVQLEAVVTTGAAAPPPVAARRREADFSAAKTAAEQRSASNVAEADSVAADALGRTGASVRRVGDRVFTLVDGRWTDSRYTSGMTVRAVKPYSSAYFELVKAIPELGDAFALGDRVLVAGATVAIEVSAAGAETLSERELASAVRAWRGAAR
jgi:Ca-activated chloride channel family protein